VHRIYFAAVEEHIGREILSKRYNRVWENPSVPLRIVMAVKMKFDATDQSALIVQFIDIIFLLMIFVERN
jgi:hypothetical protein